MKPRTAIAQLFFYMQSCDVGTERKDHLEFNLQASRKRRRRRASPKLWRLRSPPNFVTPNIENDHLSLLLLAVDLLRKLNTTTCGSCMHLAKGRHTIACCGLVDPGDLYLGGGNSSRTPVYQAGGQVPRGFNRMSSLKSGQPVHSVSSILCDRPPGIGVVLRWHLVGLCTDNHPLRSYLFVFGRLAVHVVDLRV